MEEKDTRHSETERIKPVITIIDPNRDICESLVLLCNEEGFTARFLPYEFNSEAVSTSLRAVANFTTPHILLCDVPGYRLKTNWEAFQQFAQNYASQHCVVIPMSTAKQQVVQTFGYPEDRCIGKPFDIDVLIRILTLHQFPTEIPSSINFPLRRFIPDREGK